MDKSSNESERVFKQYTLFGDGKTEKKESLDSGIAGRDFRPVQTCLFDRAVGSNENLNMSCVVDATNHTVYKKGNFLGKGGFARVHELLDTSSNVLYAGKIIPKTRITKRQHLQKIAREILIHRALVHENVVRLHHFFEDSVNAYIILENCPMKSLLHVLRHRGTVTEPEVKYYMTQLVSGVKYIHSQKVIHRDLKPGNMLLTEGMVVKVGDFGLATHEDGDARVTICGTPNYIAPEVLSKHSYSFEADVWAIGCIMFTMLAGQPPFETNSLRETYSRILANKFTIPPRASEHAVYLLKKLLTGNPKERPTLDGMMDSLYFKGYIPAVLPPNCCYMAPMYQHTGRGITLRFPQGSTEDGEVFPIDLIPNATSVRHQLNTAHVPCRMSLRLPANIATEPCRMSLFDGINPNEMHPPLAPMPVPRPSSLKQKLGRVLLTDAISLCQGGKRISNAGNLYKSLGSALCSLANFQRVGGNPPPVDYNPLCVSKWIDYSNKYGFGFQTTDKSVGVLFNDNCRMAFNHDRTRVEFHDVNGVISVHPHHSVPAALRDRLTLLRYFGTYMDENLTEGAHIKQLNSMYKPPVLHMKRWVRTNTAMIMELSNGTLQINFFKDHTKMIISRSRQGYLVTYISNDRLSRSYYLHNIAAMGCDSEIYERLRFATAVVYEFTVLEGGI